MALSIIPVRRDGPCATGMELEAWRARLAVPTLFDHIEEEENPRGCSPEIERSA